MAVWPPTEVLDGIEALPRVEEPGVRWTRRPQWHVTIRFLGRADEDDAARALASVEAEQATAVVGPAVSRLGRSVICLPVGGLDDLAGEVTRATADVGQPPEPRPFTGHLTLARLRHRGSCRLAGTPYSASFPVGEVHLVRSDTHPDGARYETVSVQALRSVGD